MAIYDPNSNQHSSEDTLASFTPTNYRVQMVFRDGEVERIIADNIPYREAKRIFYSTNSGMEVSVQVVNLTTGEILFDDRKL